MSCCAPSRPAQDRTAPHRLAPDAVGDPMAGMPCRVHFSAIRTFVGTDRPVIVPDGEGPRREVTLKAFALEVCAVTNDRFANFVHATGYVTEAERYGWSPVFRPLLAEDHYPSCGATPWWAKVDGAYWAAPEGPGSDVSNRQDHPVVHVSWTDAIAFAGWCGGRLPSEAEWEHAARGGLADPRFPWGDEEPGDQAVLCNIWQGSFPAVNTEADGFYGTSPIDAFAPNGAGLYGMAGNVWEWTSDPFRVRSLAHAAKLRNSNAARNDEKVLKGGSFLCHKSYCYRYRIAARSALTADSSASNAGIRVAYSI